MGKFFKWFFGILIALITVGVILFFCGILKVKFKTSYSVDIALSFGDIQDRSFMNYLRTEEDCKFDGFMLDFGGAGANKDERDAQEAYKEYERSKKNLDDWIDENKDDYDWDDED